MECVGEASSAEPENEQAVLANESVNPIPYALITTFAHRGTALWKKIGQETEAARRERK